MMSSKIAKIASEVSVDTLTLLCRYTSFTTHYFLLSRLLGKHFIECMAKEQRSRNQ